MFAKRHQARHRDPGLTDVAQQYAAQVRERVPATGLVQSLLDGAPYRLLADTEAPGARAWWVAGTRCTEPSQALALDVLALEPLLDLQMRAGQGTGALAAVGLVRAATAITA